MNMKKILTAVSAGIATLLLPLVASAHEVYVLSSAEIAQAVGTPAFNMYDVALQNLHQFTFWAFIGVLVVFCVFWISTLRFLERRIDPALARLRAYTPFIARVTMGVSLLAGAYFQATYGPELPIAATYGSYSWIVTVIVTIVGILTILGLWVRIAAFVALAMYGIAVYFYGTYMLTYINYLGEIIVLLIIGSHNWSVDNLITARRAVRGIVRQTPLWLKKISDYLAPRSFMILRVLFGVALIYASAYAKIIHNNLALDTVIGYHLDTLLGFEAHFLVLGAAIVELVIGIFFILGIELRFTALFFLFWLTLSLIHFGEAVWPHFMLIGIPIAYLCYGYDQYSVEGYFFRKKQYEPVL